MLRFTMVMPVKRKTKKTLTEWRRFSSGTFDRWRFWHLWNYIQEMSNLILQEVINRFLVRHVVLHTIRRWGFFSQKAISRQFLKWSKMYRMEVKWIYAINTQKERGKSLRIDYAKFIKIMDKLNQVKWFRFVSLQQAT